MRREQIPAISCFNFIYEKSAQLKWDGKQKKTNWLAI